MLSQCLVSSITKKVNSYSFVLGQQPFIALQIQNFHKCILMYPKIDKKNFDWKLFLQQCQKIQIRQKKTGANFDLTTDS